ncbi:unnamed protein product [Rhodiola kirilowii]
MTGNQDFLTDLEKFKGKSVPFGDRVKVKVLGRGTLNVQSLLRMEGSSPRQRSTSKSD